MNIRGIRGPQSDCWVEYTKSIVLAYCAIAQQLRLIYFEHWDRWASQPKQLAHLYQTQNLQKFSITKLDQVCAVFNDTFTEKSDEAIAENFIRVLSMIAYIV